MKILGEILGLLFVVAICWYFRSNENISLFDIGKILLLAYIPQRIALNIECRYLVNKKMKKMGRILIQVYECLSCGMVFQERAIAIWWPPCPFCGKKHIIHRATQELETN